MEIAEIREKRGEIHSDETRITSLSIPLSEQHHTLSLPSYAYHSLSSFAQTSLTFRQIDTDAEIHPSLDKFSLPPTIS
jgi:hypothetical protein